MNVSRSNLNPRLIKCDRSMMRREGARSRPNNAAMFVDIGSKTPGEHYILGQLLKSFEKQRQAMQ